MSRGRIVVGVRQMFTEKTPSASSKVRVTPQRGRGQDEVKEEGESSRTW